MSYSFTVRGANKDEVIRAADAELINVVDSQPTHKHDKAAAKAAVIAYVELLTVPDGKEIEVRVSGSLGWPNETPDQFSSANVSVSASVVY